jgi:hypothetical protein
MFRRIFEHLFDRSDRGYDSPVKRSAVTGEWVGERIHSFCDAVDWNVDVTRLPLDSTYYTTTRADVRTIVGEDNTELLTYRKSKYDCENFALTLASEFQRDYGVTTVGIVIDWSGGHAYNCFCYQDGTVDLYEPQSDEWVTPGEEDKYAFEHVSIII